MIVDPDLRGTIRAAGLSGIDPVTPFEGRETVGAPVLTMSGGRIIMREGEIADPRPLGRSVRAPA